MIEPKVGLHENVFEVDFASLFPNIMVNHNICERRTGLVPRVLAPLIERRMTYKKRIVEEPLRAEEYEKKQNLLKWLLVTSFGYMGFEILHGIVGQRATASA